MKLRPVALMTFLFPLCLVACADYDVKVNDNVLYSPPGLFDDYHIDDTALRDCVAQAIVDQQVQAVAALVSLNCSHAGIEDLTGLSTFTGLNRLKLSSNRIRNLMELGSLSALQQLYLDDNRIVDPVPLYPLTALQQLDLASNPALQCPRPGGLAGVPELLLPDHCPSQPSQSNQP